MKQVTARGALRRLGPLVLAASAWITACRGPTGAVRSALEADLPTLRRSIAEEQRTGIDLDRAREIARAVLEREISSARGAQSVSRIAGLRLCAPPLYDALRDRAETTDDVGAEAAMILLEDRQLRSSMLDLYASSSDGAWRALAARDTEDRGARGQRLAFFTDPDERVRRAALLSAVAAPDERDTESLLEASRVDPDPLARSLAIRALGRIGSERAVVALKDRWERADETLRLAIVDAWGQPQAQEHGGKAQLVRLVETGEGLPALQAAAILLGAKDEVREGASQKLFAAARDGALDERRRALSLLPRNAPETLELLRQASDDPDPEVQVIALARRLDVSSETEAARNALRKLARGRGSAALQARAALAAAGDGTVKELLLEQLRDERASHRKLAALGLLRLGQTNDAAPILADENPSTRTEVACQLLGR